MRWIICFCAALAIVAFMVSVAVIAVINKRRKIGRILKLSNVVFVGVALTGLLLSLPIYSNAYGALDYSGFYTALISFLNVIKMFVADSDPGFVLENMSGCPAGIADVYFAFFTVLIVVAPLFTFGFVLSFFKNISAYRRYISGFKSDVFVFSKLNERSLTLAKSLYDQKYKHRLFIFTDVFESNDEKSYELIEKANEINAICFKKDITAIDFSFHSKKSKLTFFTIGEDQGENVNQALKIIKKNRYADNANLYVFSTQPESELLMLKAYEENRPSKIRVRRINVVQSLIFRTLYDSGFENIFERAADNIGEDGIKQINAVVIGMGRRGTEMTKALSWFSQMDGYRLELNAFDIDPNAADRFASLCPELMDAKHNGVFDVDGDAKYKITVHSGVDINAKKFDDTVFALPKTTYVFIALENDEKSIAAAIKLRGLFARMGEKPAIQAVVYDSEKNEALADIKNFKGQDFEIDFIGDIKTSYSQKVIMALDVEQKALQRHLNWGKEQDFWMFDYNYKSSIASVIHSNMKRKCKIAGIEKAPAERTEEEIWAIRRLEHNRWNAYMRSEGYIYSGNSQDKSTRNDIAKKHHCLVPFDELLQEEKEKDDY